MTLVRKGLRVAKFISIHMPHTWHDVKPFQVQQLLNISIHMPHTWHDNPLGRGLPLRKDFNPHATYVA